MLTERFTEHPPVARSMLTRYRSLAWIAPRAGAGDRGRWAKNKMNTTRADARIMRPTLILAGLAWISSAIGIFLFFFLLIAYGMNTFEPSLAFLPLAIGFSVFVAIQLSKRYKQGIPFNDDPSMFSVRKKSRTNQSS